MQDKVYTLTHLLEELNQIRNISGKNSVEKKINLFKEIIKKTEGLVLKLFDVGYKTKLNVAKKTIENISKTSYIQDLTLLQFLEINEKIAQIQGKDSVRIKKNLLSEIYSRTNPEIHFMITNYYESGFLKVGFDEKLIYKKILKTTCSENSEEYYEEFKLYKKYKTNNNQNETNQIQNEVENIKEEVLALKPMLASSYNSKNFKENTYYAEIKYDGFRVIIKKSKDKISYWTRAGKKLDTFNFESIIAPISDILIKKGPENCILDGEIWLKNEDPKNCFRILSPLVKTKNLNINYFNKYQKNICLTIFDILKLDSEWTTKKSYESRRNILKNINLNELVISSCLVKDEKELDLALEKAISKNFEGIILKDKSSPYEHSRSLYWYKKKPEHQTFDVKVLGFQKGTGKYKDLYASFLVGVLKENKLVSLGKVGSGFSKKDLLIINQQILKNQTIILELTADTIMESKTYDSGYALRFPRLKRIRFDLSIPNTLERVLTIGFKHAECTQ